ncbi:MAG: LytR/AlgR family response regulator transcription factor, partial [Rhodanobacteraceae bacterium]
MHILIVEDETLVARRLARYIEDILASRISRLHVEHTFEAANEVLRGRPPDVLFLDLNLNGRDGFEMLAQATSGAFHVIVVSANVDRALEAFEYGVLDFVPKPFSRQRLQQAVDRLDKVNPNRHEVRRLAVIVRGAVELIDLKNVVFIQGADNYSEIVCRGGRRLLHQKTLSNLEMLLPERFIRIHRSCIVNLDEVSTLRSREGSRYEVTLKDGRNLPVGRSRVDMLRAR